MVVIDLVNQSLAATIDPGIKPHPGRGVNWQDPVYCLVNATPHIGEGKVLVYGADPEGRPDVAWKRSGALRGFRPLLESLMYTTRLTTSTEPWQIPSRIHRR